MTKTSSSSGPAARRGAAVVGIVLLGLVLAACSSSPNTAATTTTASPAQSSATTGAASPGGSSESSQLGALSSEVQAAEKTTFKAVYSVTGTGAGSNQSVTIEQAPPKSVFSTSSGSVINTGTTSYFCSTAGGQTTCFSAGASNPLASLVALFSPATALTQLRAAQTAAAAHAAGYNVSFTTESFGGQSSTCASISASGQSYKYCVTKQGILAYSGSGANSFALTSYSSSVPASDFALPAGATVSSIP